MQEGEEGAQTDLQSNSHSNAQAKSVRNYFNGEFVQVPGEINTSKSAAHAPGQSNTHASTPSPLSSKMAPEIMV